MKFRGLIAAAVVLAALAAALYWSNRTKPKEDAAKAAANAPPQILSLKQDDITKVDIKKKGKEDIVVSKTPKGQWVMDSPKPLGVDPDTISAVLSTLSSLKSVRLIEDKTNNLKTFGLADPTVEVIATLKNGKSDRLLIGDDAPTGLAAYAMVAGNPRVYTLSNSDRSNLDKGLNDLRNKQLLPLDFDKLVRIELHGPKLNLVFGSKDGQWVLQNHKEIRVDTSKLEGVVEGIKTASLDPSLSEADQKKYAAAYAAGTPVGTVTGIDGYGSSELRVRKYGKDYYATTTAAPGAYKLSDSPNSLGKYLSYNTDDFRENMLFSVGPEKIDKAELHNGLKAFYLTHSGKDWWSNGKKMDTMSVDLFLDWVRRLKAVNFAKVAPAAPPTIRISIVWRDGKNSEEAWFTKSGDNYIARRKGDQTLYVVAGKDMSDLLQDADQMQPVATPKNSKKK
jgi:Domain of unknown function (DUF4340)